MSNVAKTVDSIVAYYTGCHPDEVDRSTEDWRNINKDLSKLVYEEQHEVMEELAVAKQLLRDIHMHTAAAESIYIKHSMRNC
jgi:hypothetical protein